MADLLVRPRLARCAIACVIALSVSGCGRQDASEDDVAASDDPIVATDATTCGASCPQTPTGNAGGLFTSWRPEPTSPLSEDCLFLNVWTPALADGGMRPVMVLDETPQTVDDPRAAQRALLDDGEAYGNRYQR